MAIQEREKPRMCSLLMFKNTLQAGTSHFLGQNFAKAILIGSPATLGARLLAFSLLARREAFAVTYLSEEQKSEYVWATSWGVPCLDTE